MCMWVPVRHGKSDQSNYRHRDADICVASYTQPKTIDQPRGVEDNTRCHGQRYSLDLQSSDSWAGRCSRASLCVIIVVYHRRAELYIFFPYLFLRIYSYAPLLNHHIHEEQEISNREKNVGWLQLKLVISAISKGFLLSCPYYLNFVI